MTWRKPQRGFALLTVLWTIAFLSLLCRALASNPVPSSDPLLNDRTARLIGQNVLVVTAIENGEGRVKVGDSVWSARGPDAAAGSRMVVTGAEGSCLKVSHAPALPPSGEQGRLA